MNKILLIDDEESIRETLRVALSKEGYEIIEAEDGKIGIELYNRHHPILIILDLKMPIMDGIEFLEKAQIKPYDRTGVIVLTGFGEDKDIEKCYNLGVTGFLRKPHNVYELIGLVKQTIALKQFQTELISKMSSILICVDEKNFVTQWNTVAEKIFGIKNSEITGQPFAESGIQWEWKKVKNAISLCREQSQPVMIDELRFMRLDGKEGFLEIKLDPVNIENDISSTVLLYGNEITERKNLEEQLIQAQKMEAIGRLASGIIHEINTPIQYVNNNIYFLKESFLSISNLYEDYQNILEELKKSNMYPAFLMRAKNKMDEADIDFLLEEIPSAIEQSQEGIQKVADIIKSMRTLVHRRTTEKTSIDINKLIESTINIARNEWKYVAKVETCFEPYLPPVDCFPSELSRAILNVLLNAVDAITSIEYGKKGTISIVTSYDNEWVKISIKDTGTGIPEEIEKKIFRPFFTTKEIGKGTGQGLAIANDVIKRHNGKITFESEVGKGTTFIIYLPINPTN